MPMFSWWDLPFGYYVCHIVRILHLPRMCKNIAKLIYLHFMHTCASSSSLVVSEWWNLSWYLSMLAFYGLISVSAFYLFSVKSFQVVLSRTGQPGRQSEGLTLQLPPRLQQTIWNPRSRPFTSTAQPETFVSDVRKMSCFLTESKASTCFVGNT
jgi:hypothetical protein